LSFINRYLKKEFRGSDQIRVVLFTCLISRVWFCVANWMLVATTNHGISRPADTPHQTLYAAIWLFVIAGPVVEELIFRWPLYVLYGITENAPLVAVAAIISSTIFGYAHGDMTNVLAQGTVGFFLSVLFLKSGGLQYKPSKAFIVCVIAHGLINLPTAFFR